MLIFEEVCSFCSNFDVISGVMLSYGQICVGMWAISSNAGEEMLNERLSR